MNKKFLRRTLIYGTFFFVLALIAGSVISLSQVTSIRTEPVSADVAAGKRVWELRICQDCHTLLGIGVIGRLSLRKKRSIETQPF
jgi:hypothetical protein